MTRVNEAEDLAKAHVEEALGAYARSIDDIGAGYAIIRHARAGRLVARGDSAIDADLLASTLGEEAPTSAFYPLLRRAAEGAFTHGHVGQ